MNDVLIFFSIKLDAKLTVQKQALFFWGVIPYYLKVLEKCYTRKQKKKICDANNYWLNLFFFHPHKTRRTQHNFKIAKGSQTDISNMSPPANRIYTRTGRDQTDAESKLSFDSNFD